jgi:hypothetical protein
MRYLFGLILLTPLLLGSSTAAGGEVERLTVYQRQDIQVRHQRLVGNIRAQARREGVVVNLPQLYVYLSDHSAAYHLDGYRRGFERELNLIVQRSRSARSMVRLDRLLERVKTADDQSLEPADLPAADVVIALYRRRACEECEQVEATLDQWLADNPTLKVIWLDVLLDAPET